MIDKDDDCEEDEGYTELAGQLLLLVDVNTEVKEEEDHKDHMEEVDGAFHFIYKKMRER